MTTHRLSTRTAGLVVLGSFAIVLVAVGCISLFPLPGPPGPQGPQGPPGLDAGSSLPGTAITIQEVSGGSPVVAGGPLGVTFALMTAGGDGTAIDIDDLDRFAIYVSGPATNYQRVIVSEDERETSITDNGSGSYTYTFAGGFPSTYAAPPNDSDFFGSSDGELTGTAIQAGTYTVGIEARRSFTIEGETVRDAGDATFDFAVGGATVTPRQIVLQANCEECHNQLTLHGENRFSVTGCVLCHTRGAEDLISDDPAKATTGRTIWFASMIHKIHRGKDLPQVAATANGADPYKFEIIGFRESLHDYSNVGFCRMPGGVMECDACHAGASQESQIYAESNITQVLCTTCHDDLEFTNGTILDGDNADVAAGNLSQAQLSDAGFRTTPGGTAHRFSDESCKFCHGTSGGPLAVETAHKHGTSTDKEGNGLKIEIVNVGGQTGGGGAFFVAGDFPIIQFRLTDVNGNPVQLVEGDSTKVDRVAFVVSGPTSLYQHIIPGEDESRVRPWNGGSLNVDDLSKWVDGFAADGTYTYTFEPAGASSKSTAWPATYQAARNALPNQNFPFASGWGQLYTAAGTPLDNGTYTIVAYARRTTVTDGLSEPAVVVTRDVLYGAAGGITPYSGVVTDDKCNDCHGNLAFHGHARAGVRACLACHTPGVQIDDTGTDNLDLRVMIHKIHNGRNLDSDYILAGHSTHDYSHTLIPSMPGETKHCTVCHATDAWKDVPVRTNMQTWMVVCTSCHDSAATAAHASLNTVAGAPGTETCATCHGDGAAFSVEQVHLVR